MSKTGTYGLGQSVRTPQASFGNASVFGTGADRSRTATGMPTVTARATIEWPMFSSSISGMRTIAATFARFKP